MQIECFVFTSKTGFDTTENAPAKVCSITSSFDFDWIAYSKPRCETFPEEYCGAWANEELRPALAQSNPKYYMEYDDKGNGGLGEALDIVLNSVAIGAPPGSHVHDLCHYLES